MFIVIAIGMILTGIMFLIKAARLKIDADFSDNITPATRNILDLRLRQKKGLRKMGFLTILLGLALMVVAVLYPVE